MQQNTVSKYAIKEVTDSPKPPQIPSQENQSSTAVPKKTPKNHNVLKLLFDAVELV